MVALAGLRLHVPFLRRSRRPSQQQGTQSASRACPTRASSDVASVRGRAKPVLADRWEGFPNTLGLYWFGPGNRFEKHSKETPNKYFDKESPNTVIYTHGWEANRINENYRETFNYTLNDSRNGIDIDTADEWLRRGWNVGVFYWDQFSDELSPLVAEAKIYSADGDGKGMRWRTQSGFSTAGSPSGKSIVDLFTDAIEEALLAYAGRLRLVGHSLGSQVVLETSKALALRVDSGLLPPNLLPSRVALMDPYFSLKLPFVNPQDYLPAGAESTGKLAVQTVQALSARGVVFELWKTSPLTQLFGVCDPNIEVNQLCAFVERYPDWIGMSDWQGRHIAAPNLYFNSIGFPPPPTSRKGSSSGSGPSASSTDEEIRELMSLSSRWKTVQVEGMYSFDISEDRFDLVPW